MFWGHSNVHDTLIKSQIAGSILTIDLVAGAWIETVSLSVFWPLQSLLPAKWGKQEFKKLAWFEDENL